MRPGTCLADITECKSFRSQTGGGEWAVVLFPLSVLGLLYELLSFNLFEFPLSTKIPSYLLLMRLPVGYTCLGGQQRLVTVEWKFYKKYQTVSAEKKAPFFSACMEF